jgi:hypothetical protein
MMAMWERGLPPDAQGGQVCYVLIEPYLSFQPRSKDSGSGGGGSSGGAAGGSKGGGKVHGTFPAKP